MADANNKKNNGQEGHPSDRPESPPNVETNGGATTPPVFVTIPADELEQIKSEAEEYKDKYLRLLAEMDNFRKRMQKERIEMTQFGVQNVIVEILNPIDQLENALKFAQQSSEEIKHWALGFQMILNQFKEVLANHGVEPFTSVGKRFDPHYHEAIEMVETNECTPGTIVEESLRGYKMTDKVIRPARVKVSKAPQDKQEPPKENNKI